MIETIVIVLLIYGVWMSYMTRVKQPKTLKKDRYEN